MPRSTATCVTVHNVRNFAYRSENDFTPAYYDKQLDLSQLEGVDLVASYWMGPAIAHIFLSFAFAGGDHLGRVDRNAQGERARATPPSAASFGSTSCTTWWPTSAT